MTVLAPWALHISLFQNVFKWKSSVSRTFQHIRGGMLLGLFSYLWEVWANTTEKQILIFKRLDFKNMSKVRAISTHICFVNELNTFMKS